MPRTKVAIIDDSRTVRQQVRLVLEGAGHEVVEAADGQEGVAIVKANPDLLLAICDVNMPELNGLEVVAEVKADASVARVPILMLTTSIQPALIREARKLGALGWIIKPFDATQLLEAIDMVAARSV